MSKKEWKMGLIFVAFSEYLNFTTKSLCKTKQKCNQKEAFEETTVLKIDLYTVYSISMHLVALYTTENYYEYMV